MCMFTECFVIGGENHCNGHATIYVKMMSTLLDREIPFPIVRALATCPLALSSKWPVFS